VARAAFITIDPVNNIPRGASFFSDNYGRVAPRLISSQRAVLLGKRSAAQCAASVRRIACGTA